MCPPYSELCRFACTTIAAALPRMYDSTRRSIVRSPGYSFSWPGEIVLRYAVFGLNGRYVPERRVKSIRRSSRKCARCAPCTLSTESIDSSHSLVSSGSRSSNGEASDMSGVLRSEAAYDRSLKFSGQGTSCGGIASRRARHSRRPAESEARCAHAAKAPRGTRRLLAGTRRGGTRQAPLRNALAAVISGCAQPRSSRPPECPHHAGGHPRRRRLRKKYSVGLSTPAARCAGLEGAETLRAPPPGGRRARR